MSILTRAIRRLNWARRAWTPAADRSYHDDIFRNATYDATDPAYPGAITIRRFADLAAPHLDGAHTFLDLGCGPGEITCELARRCPHVRITGVDHSATAIDRARALATRMGLTNIEFVAGDIGTWTPAQRVDLVALFDAFHHVPDPEAFITRIGAFTDRFFLIEPAGNWYGGWQQDLPLDWIAESLFLMRDRLEAQVADALGPAPPGPPATPPAGEPVERRYPPEDFARLFSGFGLETRGTTAGIERYGTRPEATSPIRRDVGELTYRLFTELDDLLRRHDLDLGAKHWAIYAERGRTVPARRRPHLRPTNAPTTPLAGPYDATYTLRSAPASVQAGVPVHAEVEVVNRSWRRWSSDDTPPLFLSSRVLDRQGRLIVPDGPRTPWPRPVHPGESCVVYLALQLPHEPGRYTIVVDGVHEGITWFSQAGVPPLTLSIEVSTKS